MATWPLYTLWQHGHSSLTLGSMAALLFMAAWPFSLTLGSMATLSNLGQHGHCAFYGSIAFLSTRAACDSLSLYDSMATQHFMAAWPHTLACPAFLHMDCGHCGRTHIAVGRQKSPGKAKRSRRKSCLRSGCLQLLVPFGLQHLCILFEVLLEAPSKLLCKLFVLVARLASLPPSMFRSIYP